MKYSQCKYGILFEKCDICNICIYIVSSNIVALGYLKYSPFVSLILFFFIIVSMVIIIVSNVIPFVTLK